MPSGDAVYAAVVAVVLVVAAAIQFAVIRQAARSGTAQERPGPATVRQTPAEASRAGQEAARAEESEELLMRAA